MVELRISREDFTAVDLHLDAAQRHAALKQPFTLSPHAARVLVKVPRSVVVVILRELPLRAMQFLMPAGMSCCQVRHGSGVAVDGDGSGEREAGNGGAHGNACFKLLGACCWTLRFSAAGFWSVSDAINAVVTPWTTGCGCRRSARAAMQLAACSQGLQGAGWRRAECHATLRHALMQAARPSISSYNDKWGES